MFLEMGICILGPGVQSGPAASTWQLTVPPLISTQCERRSRSQPTTFPWPSCWHSATGVHCPLLYPMSSLFTSNESSRYRVYVPNAVISAWLLAVEHYPAVLSLSLVTSAVMVADVPSTNTLIPTHNHTFTGHWTPALHTRYVFEKLWVLNIKKTNENCKRNKCRCSNINIMYLVMCVPTLQTQ